jgi:peptidase E
VSERHIVAMGGGDTANMLEIWRVHGVDAALRSAWEAGVVCGGLSAGAHPGSRRRRPIRSC